MKDALKSGLKRLERLVELRQTYVSVAEAGVKTAEGEVRKLEAEDDAVAGNIEHTREEIAYRQTATGHELQTGEKYIAALKTQRGVIQQSLDKANNNLEQRRREWTEAMREQKVIEKMQERRSHESEHADSVELQKQADDASIGRYVRTRQKN